MAFGLGIVIFALGILIAVCLHEAGHMGTAKAFGMRVTRYFVGFGPTLFSFRRGDTEYGVKAIPLGGFVKIVGMTHNEDEIDPTTGKSGSEDPRAMWRFPVWKRTIVMSAGSITHFLLAIVALWIVFVVIGIPDTSKRDTLPVRVGSVSQCLAPTFEIDPATQLPRACDPAKDPKSPAAQAGIAAGDIIVAIDGQPVPNYLAMRDVLLPLTDKDAAVTFRHASQEHTATVHFTAVDRLKYEALKSNKAIAKITPADLERSGQLGVNLDTDTGLPVVHAGPIEGFGKSFQTIGRMVGLTFESFKKIPSKIPKLISAIGGEKRDPETPVSVVGASRIGGELFAQKDWADTLGVFATLNLFFGIFNLLPLLPMDGGHIAIAWFERLRSWLASRRGRPDPGRVDYYKLTPITLGVVAILGVFVLLTVTADIVNPITLTR